MIITVTLTPALDKTAVIPGFAPGSVNRIERFRLDPGGKGINVSKTLKSLGADSLATGILGGGTGRFIEDSLRGMGIRCDFVHVPQETRTNLKIVDPEAGTNTDINEPGAPVPPETLEEVYRKIAGAAKPGDLVVLAGKTPPGAPDSLFADWITRLHALGLQVYLDADGALLSQGIRARPDLIKPNDSELARLLGVPVTTPREALSAARRLAAGIGTVVVSLGAAGAVFLRSDTALLGRGLPVKVQSTVGAGDGMVAALAYGASAGMDFRHACALAMAVSAAAVSTPGTQAPDPALVQSLLGQVGLETME